MVRFLDAHLNNSSKAICIRLNKWGALSKMAKQLTTSELAQYCELFINRVLSTDYYVMENLDVTQT